MTIKEIGMSRVEEADSSTETDSSTSSPVNGRSRSNTLSSTSSSDSGIDSKEETSSETESEEEKISEEKPIGLQTLPNVVDKNYPPRGPADDLKQPSEDE